MKIITIHGIRRQQRWYNDLKNLSIWKEQNIEILTFEYGYFRLWRLLLPWTRQAVYKKFQKFYSENIIENEAPPSVVCHSFGTLIFFNTIKKYQHIKFNDVLLCGSLIDPHTNWEDFYKSKQINRIKNDYGILDKIVVLAGYVIKYCGPSGKIGFLNIPQNLINENKFIQDRNYFDHSDYFLLTHIQRSWVRFLLEGLGKLSYKKEILRDDIITRIYENEKNNNVEISKVIYKSRVDFFGNNGNYYGSYTKFCKNLNKNILNWYSLRTSADSTESAHNMGFYSFVNRKPANIKIETDNVWQKDFQICLLDGIQPNETFDLNYRFALRGTMNKRGDTDHYLIKNISNVEIHINFKNTLIAPTFFFIKDSVPMLSKKAPYKQEKDKSYTYYLNFVNEHNYDGIIFYYEGTSQEYLTEKIKIQIQGTAMKNHIIESCSESDLRHVYAIETKTELGNAALESTLMERRKMFNDGFLVLKKQNEVLGYIETTIWKDRDFETFEEIRNFPVFHNIEGDTLYVIFIAITEKERHNGYGTALLKAAEDIATRYNIKKIVLVAKDDLTKFYRKNGYNVIRELPNFLKGHSYKSILMSKMITSRTPPIIRLNTRDTMKKIAKQVAKKAN